MTSLNNDQESSKFRIIIKPDAFIRMITHVLRFGNEALEESVEVMGICIGKIDETEKSINLINVIPIQHGMHVSTGFNKADIELLAGLEKEYQEKERNMVGWYLSRPGWGLDFTEITIQNHKFFQTDKNPFAFVVVFDHTLMGKDNDLGFTIYSLKDFKKSDEYIEIPYEIDIPKNLNFFTWVKKLVEDSQRLTPVIIKEIKEQTSRDLQEIPLSTEEIIKENIGNYSGQVNQIISGFNNGFEKLNDALCNTYETQFNAWINETTQGTLKGIKLISRSLNQLKDSLSDGLIDVNKFFNTTFEEISSLFKKNITEYINTRVNAQQELKNEIGENLKSVMNETEIRIDHKIKNTINPFNQRIQDSLAALESTSKIYSQISESIKEFNNLTSDQNNDIKDLTKSITKNLEEISTPFTTKLEDKFEELDIELKPVRDSYSEIKILLEKLQKTITEFRNLT